jgi:hypothetical protein
VLLSTLVGHRQACGGQAGSATLRGRGGKRVGCPVIANRAVVTSYRLALTQVVVAGPVGPA